MIFTGSLLWYAAASLVMAFQQDAFDLNLWRFICGIGIGVELVTIDTYIAELVPRHVRGQAFACSQAVGFCAVFLASINIFGGFVVTTRMLAMFKKKK